MNVITQILKEFFSLFVDDGSFAVWLLLLIGAATAAVKLGGIPPLFGGALLLVGCLAILAMNAHRAARRR